MFSRGCLRLTGAIGRMGVVAEVNKRLIGHGRFERFEYAQPAQSRIKNPIGIGMLSCAVQ